MKKSTKALLLSALVLPGLGQMSLKRRKTGIALMLTAVISAIALFRIAMQKALTIVDQIMAQGIVPDASNLTNIATQASAASDDATMNLLVWIIIICWIIGIIDALRAGKRPE